MERNFIFLACQEHKTWKINFFNWLHFFFSWLFLYHKEVTRVFSSTLSFAWQFSYQWNRWCAISSANSNMQIWKNEIRYSHCLIAQRGLDLFNYTSPSVAFFLMQCEKRWLCLLRDLVFHLQNCRIQQKLYEMHKICLWLEHIRSSRKEFAYLLYNSTENTWNSQIWHPSEQNYFFVHFKISRGCAKILEIPEGGGG